MARKDLIIIGGAAPDSFTLERSRYKSIIAADSGYDTALRLGLVPAAVVGDFDSTERRDELIAKGYQPCPRDKDDTDAALAIKTSGGEYDLIGGGEGRLDHTLSLLAAFRTLRAPALWFMRTDTIISVQERISFTAPVGTELSIFPLRDANVSTSGLKWDFSAKLSDVFISQSNRTIAERVEIESDDIIFIRFSPEDFPHIEGGADA